MSETSPLWNPSGAFEDALNDLRHSVRSGDRHLFQKAEKSVHIAVGSRPRLARRAHRYLSAAVRLCPQLTSETPFRHDNAFIALARRAAEEGWCILDPCTTCGAFQWRGALMILHRSAAGGIPVLIGNASLRDLYSLPNSQMFLNWARYTMSTGDLAFMLDRCRAELAPPTTDRALLDSDDNFILEYLAQLEQFDAQPEHDYRLLQLINWLENELGVTLTHPWLN